MQFKQVSLFAMAAVAGAQDIGALLGLLPSDLASYAGSVITNTAVVGAVEGLIANTGVQGALNAIETAGPGADPTKIVQSLEVAVSNALSAAPSDQRAIVTSVVGVITSLGATDGLYSDLGQLASNTAALDSALGSASSAVSGASTMATGSAKASSGSASASAAGSSAASSNKVSTGLAPKATGMAMGAMVGAIAGVAAFL